MTYTLFYDTNALLELLDGAFVSSFAISQQTLVEIEKIKTSHNKDADVKYRARKLAHLLDEHYGEYIVAPINYNTYSLLDQLNLDTSAPDNLILGSAKQLSSQTDCDILFITDDINAKFISKNIFNFATKSIYELRLDDEDSYTGYKTIKMSDEEMATFYSNPLDNTYELLTNQYIVVQNSDGETVDVCRWDGETHKPLSKKNIKSIYFDKLKPKDIYQECAIDSLLNCQITAIAGKAGSGKSLLSLMTAMNLIESGKYERIVIMFNPTKTRGASDLGFYSGDFIDKAMQNSIGQILTTKFGDRYAVDCLLQQDKIKLVSMADARGMEILDNEILWITEAQNTSIDLIKLCLSRVSSGAKVFVEGDYTSQVDAYSFEGNNNGLKRLIDVFKGHEEFGFVQLQNAWRSRIAELCELL